MPGINKEMTVNQVLKLYPKSVGVFSKFNIDSCCGGNRSLEQAAREDKVVFEDLMTALYQCEQ
ncbi:MAG TPA: DUF542 domain-containing protein [Nitrospirota bacterium]|nr:DUF542 domain-containing protein [Nitrospirota bacterium]